ncbi:MAG: HoxN/HupN/NixA family nickel/cobalt transporter [Acidocella sp.]|nr:HoxN/HupN/NixA family nickel/cobalt transporter [Acidocella sp.]
MLRALKRVFGNDSGGLRGKILALYVVLGLANILLWGAAIATFRHYPLLLGTAFLAYSFGLRHAVDADHIAAIDNVTRKLMQQGKRPLGTGLYFSLGHSSVVFALSAAVALTAVEVKSHFVALESFGNIAGTLVSAGFLLAIASVNILVLVSVFQTFHHVKSGGVYSDEDLNLLLAKRGFFGRVFRGLFGLVEHSWQMYPVGLLFGLGFDTATEVGLLGISAAEASHGLPIWSIMLFPALFMAGMSLIDTTDGILMLGAYGWAFARPLRKLYYNITITSVSVLVALIVGGLETLGLVQGEFNLSGAVWDGVAALNGNFGTFGYIIIGVFILSWIVSVSIYKFKRYDEIEVRVAES